MASRRPRPRNALRQYGWAFGVVLAGLVASTGFVGVVLFHQTQALSGHLGAVDPIVNGNVRVLSQAQREMLRLDTLLAAGSRDADLLRFHGDLAAQRTREAALSYQVATLGSEDLLEEAETLRGRWISEVEPLLDATIAGASGAPRALREVLAELELGYNRLVSEAEINRRMNAVAANNATGALLGETRQVLVAGGMSAALMIAGATVAAVGFTRLARQRERAAATLEALNGELQILSTVASHTAATVIITDADGITTWVNDAFTALTGYQPEEAVGRSPGELLQGPGTDPATVEAMRRHLRAGEGFSCEVVNHARDGSPYWVQIDVQPVRDDEGTLTSFIAVESDITAEREAQQRLRHAKEVAEDTAAAKSSFLASMSHEIRTPLNAVIGLTELLEQTELDDQQREYVRTAAASGQLLLGVINDILNYSALEFGGVELESTPFRPAAVASRAVDLLAQGAEAKGLAIRARTAPTTPEVLKGDATRLQQVLVNLVGNAVKFTDAGSVTVDVDAVPSAEDSCVLRLRVTDTGIGIPADRIDRLFQPFSQVDASTTRRFGGTGLGLAIVGHLVELMGGAIDVDSTPGRGTQVEVTVPMPIGTTGDLPRPAAEGMDPAELPDQDLRVLLVEDDPVNQTVAVHMLARLGLTPDVVGNGVECLAAMHRQAYDVVLMDVHMPEMDGPTATRRILEQWSVEERPLIVAMTANALAGDRERLLAGGMDEYVAKPIQIDDLVGVLGGLSRRPGVGAGEDTRRPLGDSPVDVAVFRELLGAEDISFLLSVVDVFLEDMDEALPRLRAAVAAADDERTSRTAARLADAASACAAAGLSSALRDLVRAVADGEPRRSFANVERQVRRVEDWRSSFRDVTAHSA